MKINKIINYTILSVVIVCCLLLIASRFSLSNVRLFSVQSGSMEPVIKTGSMVVVKTMPNYQINDVITYYSREDNKKTITHRIVKKETVGDIPQITTRGDANDVADPIPITEDYIIGKVFFSISYVGYLIGFAKTTIGFMILIVIPVTIIVYEEMKKIHHETGQIIKRRKDIKLNKAGTKKRELKCKELDDDKGAGNQTS